MADVCSSAPSLTRSLSRNLVGALAIAPTHIIPPATIAKDTILSPTSKLGTELVSGGGDAGVIMWHLAHLLVASPSPTSQYKGSIVTHSHPIRRARWIFQWKICIPGPTLFFLSILGQVFTPTHWLPTGPHLNTKWLGHTVAAVYFLNWVFAGVGAACVGRKLWPKIR